MGDGARKAEAQDAAISKAVRRAQRVLLRTMRSDGSWDSPGDIGPWLTAQVMVSLFYVRALSKDDAQSAANYLVSNQRQDGSLVLRPYAKAGDLSATACGWAALHLANRPAEAERARRFVEANGGVDACIKRLSQGDYCAVFLALAGLVDAKRIPCPNTSLFLVSPVVHLLERRLHAGVFIGALQLEVILRTLRGEWGRGPFSRGVRGTLTDKRLPEMLQTFQNPDGSWNDTDSMTALALPALYVSASHDLLNSAVRWLEEQKVKEGDRVYWNAFPTEVWTTGFNVRALVESGIPPSKLERSLSWLCDAQLTEPMPEVNNRQAHVPKSGGWALERSNPRMPDSDDTAVVLSALGIARKTLPESALKLRIDGAIDRGQRWLFGMQNPDGGWSAFVWGLPGKKPGPAMQRNPEIDLRNPLDLVRAVISPPTAMGDPSTEDVTGRVLHALGRIGFTVTDPRVTAAIEFLRDQQCRSGAASGAFWGRWQANYVPSTSFVLMGLASVRADLTQPWIRKAIDWLIGRQNEDGGFGEGADSYRIEALAGVGPSTAPLTGLVVQALIDVGLRDSLSVRRAIDFLLKSQMADGSFPNGDHLHVNVPPDTFYVLPEAARYYPTSAFGKYLRAAFVEPPPRIDGALLDRMRQQRDPQADAVVAEIFAQGQVGGFNALISKLFTSDDPVPKGLPDAAARYFEETDALPPFADKTRIALGQKLYTRCGWEISSALFCSSLPQAYAAAKGARVLTQTQKISRHVRQRIFETAQFLFDVLDEGALEPNGRGIRAAQKVRLLHASIRHLIKARVNPAWDAQALGEPVNQEDLAGTLMTFSVVPLNALVRMGVAVSEDEMDGWVHLWNVIGHLLGVEQELLPNSLGEGEQLMELIRERQWAPSDDGRALIRPLVEMMQEYFPGAALDGLPVALIRELSGDHCADLLGLPKADWTRLLLEGVTALRRDAPSLAGTGPLGELFARATHQLMEGVVSAVREGKNAQFRLPRALARNSRVS